MRYRKKERLHATSLRLDGLYRIFRQVFSDRKPVGISTRKITKIDYICKSKIEYT